MSAWQTCPVCEGRGIVPQGFYMHPKGQPFTSGSTAPDKCRSCNGQGLISPPAPTALSLAGQKAQRRI